MTKKRFYLLSDKEDAIIFEDGFGLSQQKVCDLLNEQSETIQHIKTTIKEAYQSERIELGKSVLKQLIDNIQ